MNPIQQDNKVETKTEQEQIKTQPSEIAKETSNEPSPDIKSEENKANWKAFREQRELERKARD